MSVLTTAQRSLQSTLRNALVAYEEQLQELEVKRRKQEDIGRLFLIFKPEDLPDFSSQTPAVIESFVAVLILLKYKVFFEVDKSRSASVPTYSPDCKLRMEWALKPDEIEEISSVKYPIKHAYNACIDTIRKAEDSSAYGNELEDIEQKRKAAGSGPTPQFVFNITLKRIGNLGNSDDRRRLYGFLLLMKAHGYSVKQVVTKDDNEEDLDFPNGDSRFIVDMLGR